MIKQTALSLLLIGGMIGCFNSGGGSTSNSGGSGPTNPPVIQSYGIFRNLKPSALSSKENLPMTSSVNTSLTMSYPRQGHKAMMLDDGRIMLIGGEIISQGVYPSFSRADFFDPVAERFTPSAGDSKLFHQFTSDKSFAITKITDGVYSGKILIAGSTIPINGTGKIFELYDPALDSYDLPDAQTSYSPINNNDGMSFDSAFYLGNNKVLLTGCHRYYEIVNKGFQILDLTDWSLTELPNSPSNWWSNYVELSNGDVICIGGSTGAQFANNGVKTDIYKFNKTDMSIIKIGDLLTPRCYLGATLITGNKIAIYGGITGLDSIQEAVKTNSVEVFDLTTNTSTYSTSLLAPRFAQLSVLLQNSYVLNAGGSDSRGLPVNSELVQNPYTGQTGSTGTLNMPRRFYSAVTLNNGMVLISGGETGVANGQLNTAEIYDPQSKLIVTYTTDSLKINKTLQFSSSYSAGVNWTCDKGTIDSNGLYKAPTVPGKVKIKATAKDDLTTTAEVEIKVEA